MWIKDFKQLKQFKGIPGIYRFLFPNNKNYIGEALDLWNRLSDQYRDEIKGKRKRPVIDALIYYGWKNIKIELIDWGEHLRKYDTRIALETAWVFEYDCLIKYKKGYNVCLGGNNNQGHKASRQTIQKMKQVWKQRLENGYIGHRKGKHNTKEHKELMSKKFKGKNNPFFGKTHNQDSIQKIKDAHIGRIHTIKHIELRMIKVRKPIKQINKYTNKTIKIWPSTIDAATYFNTSAPNICSVLLEKTKTAIGFKWEYV